MPRSKAARDSNHGGGATFSQAMLTWTDIAWLKTVTKLPIFLKGVASPEDAELGIQHGADGIWVSNHGGRNLDTTLACIDMLPAISKQVLM